MQLAKMQQLDYIGLRHCLELNCGNSATSAASFIIVIDSSEASAIIAVISRAKRVGSLP